MRSFIATAWRWWLSLTIVLGIAWGALAGFLVQACAQAAGWLWALLLGILLPIGVPWVGAIVLLVAAPFVVVLTRVPMTPTRRFAWRVGAPLAAFALTWAVAGAFGARMNCAL